MPDYDELIHISATIEQQRLEQERPQKKTFLDYFSLGVTTFGVGYLPLAPGTWGSMVGVAIYLFFGSFKEYINLGFGAQGWTPPQIAAWLHAINLILFLLFCLLGIWAASRATRLFKHKDPQPAESRGVSRLSLFHRPRRQERNELGEFRHQGA